MKFLYGSRERCHYVVGRESTENRNLVPWLRNCWMRLVAASEESEGSPHLGLC